MAAEPIKSFTSLDQVYTTASAISRERQRWTDLVRAFQTEFGHAPTHVVRAPGRVNVLGEHIDYSLFPVLPAAIEQDLLIAISSSTDGPPTLKLVNTCPKYPKGIWSFSGDMGDGWDTYAKASVLECAGRFKHNPKSMNWLVSGVVPEGAGLSSSAAFVVSSVLAYLVGNDLDGHVTQSEVVKLALASEHRLGLRNGGMDQAASVFCLPGRLLHLSFHPEFVPDFLDLPSSLALVITNSMAPHALAGSAVDRYNLRVVENLCATRLLLASKGVCKQSGGEAGRKWLKEALSHWEDDLHVSEEEVYQQVLRDAKAVLAKDGGWTKEEMIAASGMDAEAFEETFLRFIKVRATRFDLYERTQHTVEESLRVLEFRRICSDQNPCPSELGRLINASHTSLKNLYAATVPQVDELQELCLRSGALGARQTGGGWGGAVVSLVLTQDVQSFLANVRSQFPPYRGLSEAELDQASFATAPGCGAGVFRLDEGAFDPFR